MADLEAKASEGRDGLGKMLPAIGALGGAAVGAYTKWKMGYMAAATGAALYGGIGLVGGLALSYIPKLLKSDGIQPHEESAAEEGH